MSNESAFDVVKGRYGTLTVFANDTGAATQSILTYGEWAENEIGFLQRLVTSGSTVLDIGAYIGTHTLAFARFVGPTGRVIAVEAQPSSFEVLKKNVTENVAAGLPDIVEFKNAIASCEQGQVTISTIDVKQEGSFGSASLAGSLIGTMQSAPGIGTVTSDHAQVPAITIDSLDLRNCALIKMDVEGVEHMVLQGAITTLERCSPFVYCECNTLAAGLKSMAVLEGVHYKVFAHVADAFNRDNYFNVKENIFGNAREVALVGVPFALLARFRSLPVRPFELLLDIQDADDLALALLNKPQYPSEALRSGHAAKTGGVEVLDKYDASKIELERLQNENAALLRIRDELEQQIQKKYLETSQVHALLTERDAIVGRLQNEAIDRKAMVTSLVEQKERDIAHFHTLMTQQDALMAQRDTLMAQRDTLMAQQDAEIARLTAQGTANDQDLARMKELISNLLVSKSWKVTKPLRWVSEHFERLFAG
jgi:FkbM family methyltransferase